MAKTDWNLNDAVMPEDMNQIGQEINDMAESLDNHINATLVHGATDAATPNRIARRDANGQFEVGAPTAANHVARKADLDAHAAITNGAHGATSAATANRIVQRDANGRAKFAAPAASDDVARKAEVDAVQAKIDLAQRTKITQDNGGPKLSITDPSRDFLAELIALGQGMHTFYVISGAVNGPPRSTRGHAFFTTGSGNLFGYVLGVDYQNITWVNYHDGPNGWLGWTELARRDSSSNKLYSSGAWAGLRANANMGTNAEVDMQVGGVRRGLFTVGDSNVEIRKYASNGTSIETRLTMTSSDAVLNNALNVDDIIRSRRTGANNPQFEAWKDGLRRAIFSYTASYDAAALAKLDTSGNFVAELRLHEDWLRFRSGSSVYDVWHAGNNAANIVSSGYQKLASGLILQWGLVDKPPANTNVTITYPIAFTSNAYAVFGAIETSDQQANSSVICTYRDRFGAWLRQFYNYTGGGTFMIKWFAIGR